VQESSPASSPENQGSIMVNGQPLSLPTSATVATLLVQLKLDGQPAAVERNGRLVPKRLHEQTQLEPGDKIEIVTLVGGG
jgi:thiamine biosynthesis protein ThiS